MKNLRRKLSALGALALLLLAASPLSAQLVADLSERLVAISMGFTGAQIVLFGATDGEGSIVVVVEGPRRNMTVRHKERVAGIWVNTQEMTFNNVPAYYRVAATAPLAEIVAPDVAELHEIGLDYLPLRTPQAAEPSRLARFREALIRNLATRDLYTLEPARVTLLGDRLFRTTLDFPSSAPTGTYTTTVYLLIDGAVAAAESTPLVVSKVGFEALVFGFAYRNGLAYGILAIAIALVAGWLASAVFRKD